MTVGLVGGTGAGKSTVAKMFAAHGWQIIDFDALSRKVCGADMPCTKELAQAFGEGILLPDGALNRRKLGELVYGDPEKLGILNKITHTYIIKEAKKQLTGGNVLLDAPLLFEAGLDSWCDRVVCVIAEDSIRLARIVARDGLPEAVALARIQSQLPQDALAEKCDDVIENSSGSPESTVASLIAGWEGKYAGV